MRSINYSAADHSWHGKQRAGVLRLLIRWPVASRSALACTRHEPLIPASLSVIERRRRECCCPAVDTPLFSSPIEHLIRPHPY
jgi:hypothetical protein